MNYLVVLIVTILLAAALKDDSAAVANSDFWYTLTVHPVVAAVKTYSPLLLFLTLICFVYTLFQSGRITPRAGPPLILLGIAVFVSAIRATAELGFAGIGMGAPLMLIFAVLLPMWARSSIYGDRALARDIDRSLLIFSTVMIVANFFTYATGYGFATGVPRLFGTSTHPNFLGVLMAICLVVIVDYCTRKWTKTHVLMIAVFLMGLLVLYKSGSRTGFIMLFVGGGLLYWAKSGFALRTAARLFCLGLGMVSAFFLLATGDVSDSPFDRGDGSATSNTRAEAWAAMIDLVKDEPFAGYGFPVGPSENSILRGWVAYGFLYAVFLASSIISLIAVSFQRCFAHSSGPLLMGLSVALALGAMLEGFLVDRFSGPIMIYIVVCCAATFTPRRAAPPRHRQPKFRRGPRVALLQGRGL